MHQPAPITVSELNRHIKNYLEQEIGTVYVEGEVSNLSKPSSGHFYFTLKDNQAQIRCVFFKNRHNLPLASKLADGQKVNARGRLSLYEARGDYQLIVDELKDAGLGALYIQYEALKNKLAAEGLFNPERKRPLPKLPKNIGIITSSNGAALQDILSTIGRRFPLASVYIYPSEVQGSGASEQLIRALRAANTHNCCDVLILARGGGSLEDLWAFNNEQLAREIVMSPIPIVSGIGHETDYTIADFVADYRAETPTAAATAITPNRFDLLQLINTLNLRLQAVMSRQIEQEQIKLNHLCSKIASPQQIIATHWQTIDYLERQLHFYTEKIISQKKQRIEGYINQIQRKNPVHYLQQIKIRLQQLTEQLTAHIHLKVSSLRYHLNTNLATLHAVSPLATLDRGYSIASHEGTIIDNSHDTKVGMLIDVRLKAGTLTCTVKKIHH